jgi:cysteine-rich repeat protein
VAFNSISEHAAVAKQMTQSVWIGGRRNPSAWGEMPAYAWTTREPWAFGPSDQWTENKTGTGPSLPWDTDNNEPNGASGDPCVELKLDPQLQVFSEMNDAGCSVPKPGLCECKLPGVPCDHDGIRDLGEECDDGNLVAGDGCSPSCSVECSVNAPGVEPGGVFKDPATKSCYAFLQPNLSWTEVAAACGALGPGFHLARIDTLPEFFLLSTFHFDLQGSSKPVWVDGTDQLAEGSWGFASSATPFPFPLKQLPWEPNEPNGGGGENCMALWWFGGSKNAYMIADWSCGSKGRGLCEREAPGQPAP